MFHNSDPIVALDPSRQGRDARFGTWVSRFGPSSHTGHAANRRQRAMVVKNVNGAARGLSFFFDGRPQASSPPSKYATAHCRTRVSLSRTPSTVARAVRLDATTVANFGL